MLLPLLLIGATTDLAIPQLTGPVVDRAGLLSATEAETIAAGLRDYQAGTGNQLQVLIVPALPEGMPAEEYAIRVVEDWKLGTAEKDNGVLLLISVTDRKWRIEVGGGLEGDLADVEASRIGREVLVPALQRGDYARGVAATLQRIAGELGGTISFEGMPVRQVPVKQRPINFLPLILIAFFILMAGRRRRGGLLAGMILGHTLGRGGWGGGGGGGGGGWSGGGGGFSGGGAGGDW